LNIQDGYLEKLQKSRYLRNGLSDVYEIGYDDAKYVFPSLRPLKSFEFQKIKMADGRHFENR